MNTSVIIWIQNIPQKIVYQYSRSLPGCAGLEGSVTFTRWGPPGRSHWWADLELYSFLTLLGVSKLPEILPPLLTAAATVLPPL